jgi:hypothetical protein
LTKVQQVLIVLRDKVAFYLAYMARWPIRAWMHVMAAIYNWFGSYIDWHHYLIDRDQIRSRIKGCTSSNQLQSTWIIDVDNRFDVFGLMVSLMFGSTVGLTFSLMVGLTVSSTFSLTAGLTVGLTVGLAVGSTWLCWAINLSKAFDSSGKMLNDLVVLQACFTGSLFYGLLTAIS